MTTDTPTRQRRCFGYTDDGGIDNTEAGMVRLIVGNILSGEWKLATAVRYLNDAGVPTTAGGKWSATTVSRLLVNPRLAGLVAKTRTSKQPAPAIITTDQHAELARRAAARKTGKYWRKTTSPREYRMLSGLLVCDVCEQRLTGHVNPRGPAYRCPDGHVQIQAAGIEQHVSDWTVRALTAGLTPVMPNPDQDVPDLSWARQQIMEARRAGLVSRHYAQNAYARLRWREKHAAAQVEQAPQVDLPKTLPADSLSWWEHTTDENRRAVACGLIRDIRISAGRQRTGHTRAGLDTSRVQITLRPDLARVS
jgi:hypothetical protein